MTKTLRVATCTLWGVLGCSSEAGTPSDTGAQVGAMGTPTGVTGTTSAGGESMAANSGGASTSMPNNAGNGAATTPSPGGSGSGGSSGSPTAGTSSVAGSGVAAGGEGTGGAASTGGTSSGGSATNGGASPTSGCGSAATAMGSQDLSLDVGGTTRTYVLSVPDGYDASTPMPVVFAWHGLGGSGMLASRYFGIERASGGGAIFVYPDGLPNDDGNAGWDLDSDGIDIQFFDALLASVSASYCVDSSRIFSTGHSFGGFFTNRLGCTRGDVLRGIAPVAGGPPFGGGGCEASLAAWITHGSNDETVDFEQGEASLALWAGNNGCGASTTPTEPSPCVAYDACPDDKPVHWCVHEDGHNWPDFAGEAVWAFFAAL